ncbi:MAG: type II secretion system GspH family protein [Heliobacteriaceae bacterium]|nr:type II secretion system GspH family protein [Heliobacteriaceae bacterium]
MKRTGFTLAEVLITLGIIGVVASLTMPALMANYRRKVAAVRLSKFYSIYSQAIAMKKAESGSDYLDDSMLMSKDDPDMMLEFFKANYEPYIKTIKTLKTNKGFAGAFPDGSGFYIRKDYYHDTVCGGTCNTYIIFCVDYKKCENIDESSNAYDYTTNGKDIFLFYASGSTPTFNWDNTRPSLINLCASIKSYCSTLFVYDGLEFKDDYPINF